MAREAKDPHEGKDLNMTFGLDKDGKLKVDMSGLRAYSRGTNETKNEQESHLDAVFNNYKRLEAEREAKAKEESEED